MSQDVVEVYRIEDSETGMGPYRDSWQDPIREEMEDFHNSDSVYHPGPLYSDLGWTYEDEFFGCESLKSLEDWFEGYYGHLLSTGFVVKLYVVPASDVRVGRLQVKFRKIHAISEVIDQVHV